jgi:acetyl esterase/lipase
VARSSLLCAVLGSLLTGWTSPPQEAEFVLRPFVYREVDDRELRAFVALPQEPGPRRPAILLFHGVGWTVGEAAWTFDRAREFAAQGLVAMSIEYRLAEDGLSPADSIEDACAAFAWAREQADRFEIDVRRVAGYGVSSGGHLVAAAATLPSVKGRPIRPRERPNALVLVSPALSVAKDRYFGELMTGHGKPASYSPAEFVRRDLPPTLVIQGEKDSVVKADHARAFCAAAQMAGARCTIKVYPNVGHQLTRELDAQRQSVDSDPGWLEDAHRREDAFLVSIGYARR